MTKLRHISPHEWIEDYFCPIVTIVTSQDAENISIKRNNLSVCELLQPFSKLWSDVTLRGNLDD